MKRVAQLEMGPTCNREELWIKYPERQTVPTEINLLFADLKFVPERTELKNTEVGEMTYKLAHLQTHHLHPIS